MPLYEYLCSACGHRFERIVKFSDAPLTTCPQCGKESIAQLISAPAVQFKGSGWYVTDYARKGSSTTAPTTAKPESSSDSTASKESSPSKPDTASSSSDTSSGSTTAPSGGTSSGGSSPAGDKK